MNYELTMSSLSIGYGTKVVAHDINAHLCEGELVCLIGRNGRGKSTLLRTMAAFQPPLAGSISIHGKATSEYTAAERARLIGVVLTERIDVHNMTVRDLVAMGRAPYTGFFGRLSDNDMRIVDDAMAQTGITAFALRMADTLSDGERQKVMIAKALAQQTPIILLDEPTAFLDYPSKVETLLLLRRLCHEQGKAVLVSTHDIDVALRITDKVWMMDTSLLTGTVDEMKSETDKLLSAAFISFK